MRIIYRFHLIKATPDEGVIYVEKDGHLLDWAASVDHAMRIIDRLCNPITVRKHKPPSRRRTS